MQNGNFCRGTLKAGCYIEMKATLIIFFANTAVAVESTVCLLLFKSSQNNDFNLI